MLLRLILTGYVCLIGLTFAQDSSALTGSVMDPSGAAVPGAKLTLFDRERKQVRYALSNAQGIYAFDSLNPGVYSLTIAREGFQDYRIDELRVTLRDQRYLRVELTVQAAASASVTVTGTNEGISADVSTGMSLDGKFSRNLPVNGRDVQGLVNLTAGIVSGAGPDGINVNGLRANTNYYTVDGVSANTGGGGGGAAGAPGPLAGIAGFASSSGSTVGSTGTGQSNLISLDAMQEVRIQTSAFAPEFGRSPGAQVSITSRGGTNDFHGSVYGYFRNQRFNANDWFANQGGIARPAMRQNNLGATLGGRLIPNRTYFFAAIEENTVASPQTVFTAVPDRATRAAAVSNLRPYLNAFPLPNGSSLGNGTAQFTAAYSNPSQFRHGSFRVDHVINSKMTAFARYARTPSYSNNRGGVFSTANTITRSDSSNETLTGSWVWQLDEERVNDFRANLTRGHSDSSSRLDTYGGAIPLDTSLIFPKGYDQSNGSVSLNIFGLGGYSAGQGTQSQQNQWNIVDTYSITSGTHQYKMGFDYRRLTPTYSNRPYSASFSFNGLTGTDTGTFLSAVALNAAVSSNVANVYPLYVNYSAYWQDTWKATDRTTLTYGVRWDVNPAPRARSGDQPLALTNDNKLTQSRSLYGTRWANFAPRFGVAYLMDDTAEREMMFRGGFGYFYDIGYGTSSAAFSGAPYSNTRLLNQQAFPLTGVQLAAPGLPAKEPYGQVNSADPNLLSPRIYQWQLTIEKFFGRAQSLEIGYVGTKGTRMARQESRPIFPDNALTINDATLVRLTTNGAESEYHGMNVSYRRRFSSGLSTQINYTWAHAIDSASNDFGGFGFAFLSAGDRGNSNYDVRHNLKAIGSYQLPRTSISWLKPLVNTWALDYVTTWRTGLPFDITAQSNTTSNSSSSSSSSIRPIGFFGQGRPNYNGKPVYVDDPNVPGGKRVNKDAFTAVSSGFAQGNLGRNSIRGFGQVQADITLRRNLQITERLRFQFRLEGYNLLNHPNFSNPNPQEGANLSSSNFGIVNRMANQGFGGSNVYSNGGPRNMQVSLRLEF